MFNMHIIKQLLIHISSMHLFSSLSHNCTQVDHTVRVFQSWHAFVQTLTAETCCTGSD